MPMLIKCVCSNCGHSYLSDDSGGELACPRCDSVEHGAQGPVTPPSMPRMDDSAGFQPEYYADLSDGTEGFDPASTRFQAKAPPAMFLTMERFFRGLAIGGVATAAFGALIGAALAALSLDAPGVAAIAIALIAGVATRSGFGGRTAQQTRMRASVAAAIVVLLGFTGFAAGSWAVERLAGARAHQTYADLDQGLKGLTAQYNDVQDAGAAVVIKERIEETRRLRGLSDSQLEDYLWVQEAQINNPLLAHAKLRATTAPVIRLGPGRKSIRLSKKATMPIRAAELLLALGIAASAVRPRR